MWIEPVQSRHHTKPLKVVWCHDVIMYVASVMSQVTNKALNLRIVLVYLSTGMALEKQMLVTDSWI